MKTFGLTLPGAVTEQITPPQAPVNFDGSFLLRPTNGPFDHDPPYYTPVDEFSGLPWVIIPPEYPLPANRSELADDNHAFHPSSHPLFLTTAGEALRNSRVQRVDWYDHHIVYHKYFAGPELPTTEADIFRRVVFAVARYIPERAINCNESEPKAQLITEAQKSRLWRTGELRVWRPGQVRGFLGNYVVQQDLSHVEESRIDEFVSTTDDERRQFLGHWLLAQATEVATEPIDLHYRLARQEGKIPPHLTSKSPNLVKDALGNKYQRSPYVKMLKERLVA